MKLALVAIHLEPSPRALPLGPAMLAAALHAALPGRVQAAVLDAYVDEEVQACADRVLAQDPQVVGLSMYVWNRGQCLALAERLKAMRPDLVLLAGGAEATADLAGVQAHPAIDLVLPGEGELLLVEVVKALLAGAAPADLVAGMTPMPVKDLATVPSPFLDGTLDPGPYGGALWELSRGCPFTCDFCFESRGTAGVRRIPLDRAEAELDLFRDRGIREVFVLDPTFNYHRAQAKDVLRLIARKAPDLHWFFEVRSEFLDREMAELFAQVRCTLQIGLQSAHDAVLRQISRTFNPGDFEAKILLLHQAGVAYGFDLIYGLPGDSLAGFMDSVDFAMGMVPNHLDIFRLSVLPGTRLAETAGELGLAHQAEHPYSVTGSGAFPAEDLATAERIAQGCDALYNHGKAVTWLDLLLGPLEMRPSEVFLHFADHLEAAQADLLGAQRAFFQGLFAQRHQSLLGDLASDLIAYFGTTAALMDGEGEAFKVAFHHDPRVLIAQVEGGMTDLEELVFHVAPDPCVARLRLEDGELVVDRIR